MPVECDRWNWRELVASEDSCLPPTTRHVLLTLSLHMNEHGDNAWPSQMTLVSRTGLSLRAVRDHLASAERSGWIKVQQRRRGGQAWFHHQYLPTVPDSLADKIKKAPWEGDCAGERPARHASRQDQRPAPDAAREAQRAASGAQRAADNDTTPGTSFHNARHLVPTNSSSNSSINKSRERLLTQTNSVFREGRKEPERKHTEADDQHLIEIVRKNVELGLDDSKIKSQLHYLGSDDRIQRAITSVRNVV